MRLYGNDIDETTTVLEADLEWIVGWDKGDFNGRDGAGCPEGEGARAAARRVRDGGPRHRPARLRRAASTARAVGDRDQRHADAVPRRRPSAWPTCRSTRRSRAPSSRSMSAAGGRGPASCRCRSTNVRRGERCIPRPTSTRTTTSGSTCAPAAWASPTTPRSSSATSSSSSCRRWGRRVKKGDQVGHRGVGQGRVRDLRAGVGHGHRGQRRPRREARGHQPGRARQLDGGDRGERPRRGASPCSTPRSTQSWSSDTPLHPQHRRGRAPDARGHRGPEHRRAVRTGSRGRPAPARAGPAAGAVGAGPDGAPRRAGGAERRRVALRGLPRARAPTGTSPRASSTSSCCAPSSTRPTRRTSRRSRRARCRRSSSSRRWSAS